MALGLGAQVGLLEADSSPRVAEEVRDPVWDRTPPVRHLLPAAPDEVRRFLGC
jgi:hypothetical protein